MNSQAIFSKAYLQRGVPTFSLDTRDGAPHDEAMPTDTTVPLWSDPLELNIPEPRGFEPLNVLLFSGEQHPHVGEEARQPEGRVHRADQTSLPAEPEDPVGFLDSPLRVGPVLDAGTIIIRIQRQHYYQAIRS